MKCGYLEISWVELLGQHIKWFGILSEVADLKNGLRMREVVFLEIGIETGIRTTEVWNTSSCG